MHIWQHKNLRYMYSEGKRRERGKEEVGEREEVMYCMYIYIYIYIYIYMQYIRTFIYTYIYMYIHLYV